MPRREDIQSILILGSGPIVIGQACEFDYSGTQGCRALKEEGYRVILVNSNPATIMTDPGMADRTYVEPIEPGTVEKILEREKPDALLSTLGGQTALNCAVQLAESGVLERLGVEMLGADGKVIEAAEGRESFRRIVTEAGLEVPRSALAHDMAEARAAMEEIGLPLVIRPAYTLGGTGGGIGWNVDEFEAICRRGLELSLKSEVLLEECIAGWKEFELEVMRDGADNAVIVCSIENLDPMGVHTGDSITVAPAQTLTDREYQRMRDAAIRIIRAVGLVAGGANIQFAVDPRTGRMVVIEMNPRVSRSSALASKATGFPIARIAAKLAVGYTLPEIPNDITRETPACFEPAIDYCVVKIPRFAFEKFHGAEPVLTTQMKSVGEVMAIGRTFKESFQKALRSLETGIYGLGREPGVPAGGEGGTSLRSRLATATPERVFALRDAFLSGMPVEEVYELTGIDPWFLENIREIVEAEKEIGTDLENLDGEKLRALKRLGFADRMIAAGAGTTEWEVRARRKENGIVPVFNLVDTCAGEFEAYTPYYYSTYETRDETRMTPGKKRVVILGGGPNRIGQGIEFDYCCVHAALAFREMGWETLMVNSNPETVSTDFDISDHLFFEPLSLENVLDLCERVEPDGIVVQFGGQTPINLARPLADAGLPLLGTPVEAIELAEDRDRFREVLGRLGLRQPKNGMASSIAEAMEVARRIGYPVIVRPSFVLGGRAMEIVWEESQLEEWMERAVQVSPDRPILVDKFLEDAIEVDVDALGDGEKAVVAGLMEHIEEAGIHSGDSCCSLPPYTLSDTLVAEIRRQTLLLAGELGVRGLMNVQFAVQHNQVYVLEVNPRASRTVPFVAKATGVPLPRIAARVMAGMSLEEAGLDREPELEHFAVKIPVFPFNRFPGVDTLLGPEMRSTGEVMGVDKVFGSAFAKAGIAAGWRIPLQGRVFVSVKDEDKRFAVTLASRLQAQGFRIVATRGTAKVFRIQGVDAEVVHKVTEGRPNVVDLIKNRQVDFVINTPSGAPGRADGVVIRAEAAMAGVPCITNLAGAAALVHAIETRRRRALQPIALQDLS